MKESTGVRKIGAHYVASTSQGAGGFAVSARKISNNGPMTITGTDMTDWDLKNDLIEDLEAEIGELKDKNDDLEDKINELEEEIRCLLDDKEAALDYIEDAIGRLQDAQHYVR